MKKIMSLFLTIVMLLGIITALPMTANAQNETNIPNNKTWYKFNVRENTTEYFSVTLPNSGRLKFSIFAATYGDKIHYQLYDNDYENCMSYGNIWVDENKPTNYTIEKVLSKGKYHLILEIGDKSGYIKLKSNFKNYKCNAKSFSTYDNPNTLTSGKTYTDAFTETNSDVAWYIIKLTSKRIVQLNLMSYHDYTKFYLYNRDLNKEYFSESLSGNESSPGKIIKKITLQKGNYYLKCEQRLYNGMFKIGCLIYTRPKLNYTNTTVKVKKTKQLKVTGGTGRIVWSSSNKRIATVNSKGKVYGKKKGNCVITARRNGYTMRCTLKVKK